MLDHWTPAATAVMHIWHGVDDPSVLGGGQRRRATRLGETGDGANSRGQSPMSLTYPPG
jgi:hypothetical protein